MREHLWCGGLLGNIRQNITRVDNVGALHSEHNIRKRLVIETVCVRVCVCVCV